MISPATLQRRWRSRPTPFALVEPTWQTGGWQFSEATSQSRMEVPLLMIRAQTQLAQTHTTTGMVERRSVSYHPVTAAPVTGKREEIR